MSQLNINMTPEFESDLERYMKKQGLKQKSEAIRRAVSEALERLKSKKNTTDFESWYGVALKAPLNAHPRFNSEDDLWV